MLTPEPFSERADLFIATHREPLIVSDFGAAEVVSAIARRVRMKQLTPEQGHEALRNFDRLAARVADRVTVETADIANAGLFLRRFDLALRTPDAVHIAVAQRLRATLVTFDREMAANAVALGMAVATP